MVPFALGDISASPTHSLWPCGQVLLSNVAAGSSIFDLFSDGMATSTMSFAYGDGYFLRLSSGSITRVSYDDFPL